MSVWHIEASWLPFQQFLTRSAVQRLLIQAILMLLYNEEILFIVAIKFHSPRCLVAVSTVVDYSNQFKKSEQMQTMRSQRA